MCPEEITSYILPGFCLSHTSNVYIYIYMGIVYTYMRTHIYIYIYVYTTVFLSRKRVEYAFRLEELNP